MNNLTLSNIALYISRVKASYPYGIPQELLNCDPLESTSARLVVVGIGEGGGEPFSGSSGDLLRAAITKGLRLSLTEVAFVDSSQFDTVEVAVSEFDSIIDKSPDSLVIFLGNQAATQFGIGEALNYSLGEIIEFRNLRAVVVSNPIDVTSGSVSKAVLWRELQPVIEALSIR
ncbi:MAG: hypothetical protein KDD53_00235 [Bdellovibrionales bacterium]|nr:hypothetical protein [Bdellovibrionales bacterium]